MVLAVLVRASLGATIPARLAAELAAPDAFRFHLLDFT